MEFLILVEKRKKGRNSLSLSINYQYLIVQNSLFEVYFWSLPIVWIFIC